jgi:hypothetical protein
VATALKSCFSGEKGALLEPAFLHELRWNVVATGVVTALVIAACWVPDGDRPASPAGTPSVQRSNVIQQQIPFVPPNSARSNRASKAQTAVGEAEEAKSPSSAFKQLRGGPNEIDYIAADVTIRHFTTKPVLPRVRGRYKEVDIGEDVTVRYLVSTRPK